MTKQSFDSNCVPKRSLGTRIKFENLSLEDGLSQSVVSCIIQDSIGFMWFGTQDGLNRYDGKRFVVYKHDKENPYSICSNFIICLMEDKDSNLWIGTQYGFCRYDRDRERFINYKMRSDDKAGDPLINNISRIYQDESGQIWIGTYGGGLLRFEFNDESFRVYRNDKGSPLGSAEDRIMDIIQTQDGKLWIGTWGAGLKIFDKEKKQFVHCIISEDENIDLNTRKINSFYCDRSGNLFVCTNNGLFLHRKGGDGFRNFKHNSDTGGELVSLIYEDSSNNYWVGTREDGLNSFEITSGEFFSYKNDQVNPYSISNDNIMSVYEDSSGIIWVGTFGGGINKFSRVSKKIKHYFSNSGGEGSLISSDIVCFCELNDLRILIGTRNGGLSIFDRNNQTFKNFIHNPEDPDSISHNDVESISADKNNNIWIGTSGGGLDKFDIEKGIFKHYKKDPYNSNSLPHNTIFALAADESGIIWIGTVGGGLGKFDPSKNEFSQYVTDADDKFSISSNRIRCLFFDRANNLWIGTDNGGLNRFCAAEEKFFTYKNISGDNRSLSDNNILSIYEDTEGTIWVGTAGGGLNKLNEDRKTFTRYTEKDGLPNGIINGMLEDTSGNLWISTNNGISKFDKVSGRFRNYDVRDGFQSNEFNYSAYAKLKSGELIFGGINGFNIFDPDDVKDNPFIPPVVISDFQIFNKHVPIYQKGILKKSVSLVKEIILSYRESVFSFEFASLDYNIPSKNQYAYLMEGFEKEWVYSGNRGFATYTNLNPGDYMFKVKASNNDGVWNEDGTNLKITITPPFWKRWWFRALGAAAVAGTAGRIYQNKINQIKKEKKVQEEFTKRLIEVQESDRKKISHELHDSIGQEILISKNILLSSIKKIDDKESVAQNINEVSAILTDTLKDVREISYSLHPYQIERLGLSKAIKSIIDRASKSTDIKFFSSIDKIDKLISPEIEINLYRIIQESINNIVKHSKASEVILNVSCSEKLISILISDNGVGFSTEKVKANSHKHGLGLFGMNERIKIFDGKIKIDSIEGEGTSINIHIPLK